MILAMIFRSRNVVSFISLILMVSNAVALPLLRSVDLLNQSKNWNESSALMTGKQTKMSKMSMSMSMIADVQVHFIEQLLDHFDTTPLPSNLSAVLFQRYFYSPRFVSLQSPSSPQYAFLCVGGEGPALDKSVLVDSVHCTGDMLELARRLYEDQGASVHLFALEHRYYGHSYPILGLFGGQPLEIVICCRWYFFTSCCIDEYGIGVTIISMFECKQVH